MQPYSTRADSGRRIAFAGIVASGALAIAKILIGWVGGSTSVIADGVESAGDVFTSGIVLFGLIVASRPPDQEHPYGHGRFEMLTGLGIGVILGLVGIAISVRSLDRVGAVHAPPQLYTIWPLFASIAVKATLSTLKFRVGRRIRSAALMADAWNDSVDILSAVVALTAVGLTLYDPAQFLAADHFGGFAVGVIVCFTAIRVVRDTSLQLMDTMPDPGLMQQLREAALRVPGVHGVEKCYARKTGFQYHVDLHLEVDPDMTVRESHDLAHLVRMQILASADWVADVLVHVEPWPGPDNGN
ncbi:MAG TPA: cation diffusion facilitator family transporter [Bryobacteraceae bacterium]|nr:cation diffusion facilitator family transporter [Bryobacteraceae bacterium]